MTSSSYILLTAAYNEERFLPGVIAAVAAQTVKPDAWMIVSDASTDGTDRIAEAAAAEHGFIRFLRFQNPLKASPHPMGGLSWRKVAALRAGLEALGNPRADFLGVLDSDVTFAPGFFEALIARMRENPTVGIGGGMIWNWSNGREWPYVTNPDSVGGPVQFFRRTAWDDIGGYIPWGHEDVIAQMMARMRGWRTTSFPDPELKILHLKTAQEKKRNPLKGSFYCGRMDRAMRNHPLFQVAKCVRHLAQPPLVVGGLAELSGFAWAALKGVPTQLPAELVSFNQREQMAKLKRQIGL